MCAAPSESSAGPSTIAVSVRSGMRSVYASPYQPSIENAFVRSKLRPGAAAGAAPAAGAPRSPGESGASSSGSIGGVSVR